MTPDKMSRQEAADARRSVQRWGASVVHEVA
jgi:hypothetical protein